VDWRGGGAEERGARRTLGRFAGRPFDLALCAECRSEGAKIGWALSIEERQPGIGCPLKGDCSGQGLEQGFGVIWLAGCLVRKWFEGLQLGEGGEGLFRERSFVIAPCSAGVPGGERSVEGRKVTC
jgi:hypothetical protein